MVRKESEKGIVVTHRMQNFHTKEYGTQPVRRLFWKCFYSPSFLEMPVDRFTFKGSYLCPSCLVCACVCACSANSLFSCEDKDPTMLWLFGAGLLLHVLIFKLVFLSSPKICIRFWCHTAMLVPPRLSGGGGKEEVFRY